MLKKGGMITAGEYDDKLLCGTVRLEAEAERIADTGDVYSSCEPERKKCMAYAVPYYTWGNRGENQMRVWLPVQ